MIVSTLHESIFTFLLGKTLKLRQWLDQNIFLLCLTCSRPNVQTNKNKKYLKPYKSNLSSSLILLWSDIVRWKTRDFNPEPHGYEMFLQTLNQYFCLKL